jgi:hypothetical protein
MKKTAGKKKRKSLVGYTREDWEFYTYWTIPCELFTKTQSRDKLCLPAFYSKDDTYIDGRTRHKKVKVRLIIEEI